MEMISAESGGALGVSLTVPLHHPLSTLTTAASASDRPERQPLILRVSAASLVREWVLGGLGAPFSQGGAGNSGARESHWACCPSLS